jgi:hypothetical protein
MKKISLSAYDVHLLNKISESGYPFYVTVTDFLEENENLSEEETKELTFEDDVEDDFYDMIAMISGYLKDDSLSDDDMPTDSERTYLEDFLKKQN